MASLSLADVINRREAARESSETLLAEVDASVARLEALRAHATERSRLRETATGEASSYHGTTLSTAKAKLLLLDSERTTLEGESDARKAQLREDIASVETRIDEQRREIETRSSQADSLGAQVSTIAAERNHLATQLTSPPNPSDLVVLPPSLIARVVAFAGSPSVPSCVGVSRRWKVALDCGSVWRVPACELLRKQKMESLSASDAAGDDVSYQSVAFQLAHDGTASMRKDQIYAECMRQISIQIAQTQAECDELRSQYTADKEVMAYLDKSQTDMQHEVGLAMVSHFTSLDAQRQGERDKASLFASIKDAEHRVRAFDAELVSVDAEAEDARRQQDEKVKMMTQISDMASDDREAEIKKLRRERGALAKAVKRYRRELHGALREFEALRAEVEQRPGATPLEIGALLAQISPQQILGGSSGVQGVSALASASAAAAAGHQRSSSSTPSRSSRSSSLSSSSSSGSGASSINF